MKKGNSISVFLNNYNLTEGQFRGKSEIDGSLDLSNLTSIPEGFNPPSAAT